METTLQTMLHTIAGCPRPWHTHTHAATNKTQHNCFAKRKPRSTLAYNRLEVTSKCLPTADRELKRAPFDGQDARTRVSHTTGVFDAAGCGE